MDNDSGYQHGSKWPRRLVPQKMHYIVHKVAEATVRDGAIGAADGGGEHRHKRRRPRHPPTGDGGAWRGDAVRNQTGQAIVNDQYT